MAGATMEFTDDFVSLDESFTQETRETFMEVMDQLAGDNHILKERLAELELELDDEGWRRIGAEGEMEFTRGGLAKIIAYSRIMFLKNPLIQRAVEVRSFYVWGQGIRIQAEDKAANKIVQDFLDDPLNRKEFTGHSARVKKDQKLQIDGNIFFVLVKAAGNGVTAIRSLPIDQVTDIICNPEDRREVWFYKREWSETSFDLEKGGQVVKERKALYPDATYEASKKSNRGRKKKIGEYEMMWDQPVYHVQVGHLDDMRFGVPETYSSLAWAKAYKGFLEDWATLVRSISKFAWNITAKKGRVTPTRQKIADLYGEFSDDELAEKNLRTNTNGTRSGSAFISDGDVKLNAINKSGATTSAQDGKQLRLMVASGMHLPDTILSNDPQQGALATAKTLDRPTELALTDRQTLWADIIQELLKHVLRLSGVRNKTVKVTFPRIVEQDMKDWIEALVAAFEGGKDGHIFPKEVLRRHLLTAIGEEDIDEIQELMQQVDDDDAEAAAAQAALPTPDDDEDEGEEGVAEAVRSFVNVMKEARDEIVARRKVVKEVQHDEQGRIKSITEQEVDDES